MWGLVGKGIGKGIGWLMRHPGIATEIVDAVRRRGQDPDQDPAAPGPRPSDPGPPAVTDPDAPICGALHPLASVICTCAPGHRPPHIALYTRPPRMWGE